MEPNELPGRSANQVVPERLRMGLWLRGFRKREREGRDRQRERESERERGRDRESEAVCATV